MHDDLTIHGFETSNNMKVRVALGYKGIAYRFETIDPADRAEILAVSGQPLTPVMRHGEIVLFDSAAILRYLDANFPETPRLFAADRAVHYEIEGWELFGRARLLGALMVVVRQVLGGAEDSAELERAADDLAAAVDELASVLRGRQWLVGEALTAADVSTAPVLHRIRVSGMLPLPDSASEILEWVGRVMAFDAGP